MVLARHPIADRYREYLQIHVNEFGCCSRLMIRRLIMADWPDASDRLWAPGQSQRIAYFASGQHQLDPLASSLIEPLARKLKKESAWHILVTGYA
ncbi:hypothetical protein RZS08_67585, partial [Arthrospira platensis SPKY1]|nr:hypothetical protein [Arthrospira platensis SPKY1]